MQILFISLFQLLCSISFQSLTLCLLLWATLNEKIALLPLFMLLDSIPALATYRKAGQIIDNKGRSAILKMAPFVCLTYISCIGFAHYFELISLVVSLGLCAFGVSVYKGFHQPLIISMPLFLRTKQEVALRQINSCIQASEQLGRVIGFLMAGLFITHFNIEYSFILVGALFLLILIVSSLIRLKPLRADLPKSDSASRLNIQKYFKENPSIKFFMSKVVFFNFLFTPFMVFFSLYSKNLSFTSAQTGALLSFYATAQLILFITFYFKPPKTSAQNLMKISFIIAGLCQISLFFVTSYLSVAVTCFVLGLAMSCANLTLTTCMQKKIPAEIQGQVVGVLKTYSNFLMPFGYIAAGLVVSKNMEFVPILYFGCGLATILLSTIYSNLTLYKEFFHGELNIRN